MFDLEIIKKFYYQFPSKIKKIRRELIKPLTLSEKILYAHLDNDLCNKISSDKIVVVANYNTENQIVVSGHTEAVESLVKSAKEFGAKMVVPLNVSGAFHSPLMSPAREELADKLDSIDILDIQYPLYTNVDAKPITKGIEIKKSLIRQLENPVQWHSVIQKMIQDGSSIFTEIGPGKVLQGLNRKIDRTISTKGIHTYEDILNYNVWFER